MLKIYLKYVFLLLGKNIFGLCWSYIEVNIFHKLYQTIIFFFNCSQVFTGYFRFIIPEILYFNRVSGGIMSLFNNPMQLIVVLFCLSIMPLFAVMGTSFLKISIVLSMLRNALGIQQIPPNMAIYGLALVLTLFAMAPVGFAIRDNIKAQPIDWNSVNSVEQINSSVVAPYQDFLKKNTSEEQIKFFTQIGYKIWPKQYQTSLSPNSLLVMVPAFTMSQLIEAFKIGFLIYLPFVAIDLIVSNVLLAMGMMMVSPMTIALPFKLLIFILMGGWDKLIGQLMVSFS